ncbi:hypothetical protein BCV70DRAFT_197412 [Testicularia cyperi]|uniref:Uncharacterized protein n=1 Tax=Testicularia cyperi TaxID=1882483 RepID=A0A317XXZ2_9BASI|nr:hypothetical protein BCV70DRAFT_197412 [Testicularia cyperi]
MGASGRGRGPRTSGRGDNSSSTSDVEQHNQQASSSSPSSNTPDPSSSSTSAFFSNETRATPSPHGRRSLSAQTRTMPSRTSRHSAVMHQSLNRPDQQHQQPSQDPSSQYQNQESLTASHAQQHHLQRQSNTNPNEPLGLREPLSPLHLEQQQQQRHDSESQPDSTHNQDRQQHQQSEHQHLALISSSSSSSININPSATTMTRTSTSISTNPVRHSLGSQTVPSTTTNGVSSTSSLQLAGSSRNMSPPRPTRSLPRRSASARTLTRPVLSSSQNASNSSGSEALRSRSISNSTILSTSSSNANIMASGSSSSAYNRQNLPTGCGPFSGGGSFDPLSNPPSGMSTPRTPLAEIPLWLADMRSESRRASASSASIMDRDTDWLTAGSGPSGSRHSRTASFSSSSQPPSPGNTRNGSTSPATPFRRSLRSRRPRQSDENSRLSPSPSYFGEDSQSQSQSQAQTQSLSLSQSQHSISSGSSFGMTQFDGRIDSLRVLSSSSLSTNTGLDRTGLGMSSQGSASSLSSQLSGPAMSTRSRTLGRPRTARTRRMTNSISAPLLSPQALSPSRSEPMLFGRNMAAAGLGSASDNTAPIAGPSALSAALNVPLSPIEGESRRASLLERRATQSNSSIADRVVTRSSSRSSSPARTTRSSRRRSMMMSGSSSFSTGPSRGGDGSVVPEAAPIGTNSSAAGSSSSRPLASLSLLDIPGHGFVRASQQHSDVDFAHADWQQDGNSGLSASSSESLLANRNTEDYVMQVEPISPSAYSEMTSLTQGSTAAESSISASSGSSGSSGPPLTPLFVESPYERFLAASAIETFEPTDAAATSFPRTAQPIGTSARQTRSSVAAAAAAAAEATMGPSGTNATSLANEEADSDEPQSQRRRHSDHYSQQQQQQQQHEDQGHEQARRSTRSIQPRLSERLFQMQTLEEKRETEDEDIDIDFDDAVVRVRQSSHRRPLS